MLTTTSIGARNDLPDSQAKSQRIFVWTTLLSCLLLQRIGLPSGTGTIISLPVPILGCMAIWYLWTDVLVLDRRRVAIMLGLFGIALITVSTQKASPIAIVTRVSMVSLIYWLGITSFAVLRFARPMDERVFFNILLRCLAFIGVCGLVAFLAQFVGLKVFTFRPLVPAIFSMEPYYNVVIPLTGTIIKANGFFLVEPSVFSQFMALGLICEWITRRRPYFIALFMAGLFCSASGTGWLMVGTFVAYTALTMGGRGLVIALVFSGVCLVAFIAVSFVVPAITESLSSRLYEINSPGTSGNERFVTPVLILRHVLSVAPWAFFTGIGPGGSDSLAGVTIQYTMNSPIKIILEYGIFGLLFYFTLILCNRRTPAQNAVLLPVLVLLLFAGGYEHFPPILFPVLLILTVANLAPTPAAAPVSVPVAVPAGRHLAGYRA